MCYSFRTSIISYTLGMISAIFALFTRQYILGLLILFYVQMQLSEAIIWKGIDSNDRNLNKIGTMYGKHLLPTHLFAIGAGYLLAIFLLKKRSIKASDFIPLIIGIIFLVIVEFGPYSTNYPDETYPKDKKRMSQSCQNNNNRLRWPFPHTWYLLLFILAIIFIIFYIKPVSTQIFIGLIFVTSFFVIMLFFPIKSLGSVWCFSAAILAPILVIGNYLIIRDKNNSEIMT
jgi:hypothetical protein